MKKMTKKMQVLVYVFYFGCFLFFCNISSVSAMTVSPLRQVISVEAGQKAQVYLEVKNNTKEALKIKMRVTGVKQNENGQPIFADNSDYAETWVSSEKNSIIIAPGEVIRPVFIVRVPSSAETRLHYLGLMVSAVPSGGEGIAVFPEVASYLLVQVAGTVDESMQVVGWNLSKKIVFWKDSLPVNLALRNSGTSVLPVSIDILVTDFEGKEVFSENKNIRNVLPGALRTSDMNFNLSEYSFFGAGLYDVGAVIRYGNFGVQEIPQLRFFYFSKFFSIAVGVVFVGAVVFSVMIYFWRRKKN